MPTEMVSMAVLSNTIFEKKVVLRHRKNLSSNNHRNIVNYTLYPTYFSGGRTAIFVQVSHVEQK